MNRNSSFEYQHQQIPTLQSIEAHSEVSVDLRPNQLQPLISKIFMLCIELERKDIIIDQLQTQAQFKNQMKKSQLDTANKQFMVRYDRLEQQNRILIQSNVMLKNNAVTMERVIADLEVHRERSAYNKELEEKVYGLELRVKKAEQEKIQYLERQKNLKRQNSMLSYSAIKTSQKNRIRDLEHQLSQQRAKLDAEKRLNADLKYQLEKDVVQIKSLKESEHTLKRSYEQKIQKIELVKANQDLRQSQCTAANQQKIALLSQQLNRLREELQQQRSQLKQQKLKVQQKDGQIRRLIDDIRSFQQKLSNKHKSFESLQQQKTRRQSELLIQIQSLEQTTKTLKMGQSDVQLFLKQKQIQEQDRNRQLHRMRIELQQSQKIREELSGEMRKMKRKTGQINSQCQICKIRSSTLIPSSKSVGNGPKSVLNLQQIIQQTQKLNLSNKKVESLINHHEISVQYSQHSIINTSQ